jgi:3-methylcrotonyl-CoA carboxylase alpha subunit
MGSKSAAKALMERAGVPLVPGYHGADQDAALLAREAQRIGYPALIKASAGGGGKGMRIVERAGDFAEALASAKREAASSFGDDAVLVERYLQRPRHIEMQVFADSHGNTIHLFERDCSVQRRHQKVVEEAPAPGMDPARRERMGGAAVAAAKAVGYVGAGTVEFIAEGDDFYFMEMNTRLQVEHPVTEKITDLDLVEWQLRVAAGEPLPRRQSDLQIHGHAFEARIYAEDPARDFLPSTGRLQHLRAPGETHHVRIDTGVRSGDAIGIHYDPMIAKLIVWGEDRAAALRQLQAALGEYEILGLATNLGFLARLAAEPDFAAGAVDTGFIARHRAALLPEPQPAPEAVLAAASLSLLLDQEAEARQAASLSSDPYSPWHRRDGWRVNGETYQDLLFEDGAERRSVRAHYRRSGWRLDLGGGALDARAGRDGTLLRLALDGAVEEMRVLRQGSLVTVLRRGIAHALRYLDPAQPAEIEQVASGRLSAPMTGKIIAVLTRVGAEVRRGERLIVLEAMKMEHSITAPGQGIVERIRYRAGELVEEGAELLVLRAPETKSGES